MQQTISWIVLILAVIIFVKTYFLHNKRLQEGQKQIEQFEIFCHEFMSTVIRLMDELEEKKQQIEQITLPDPVRADSVETESYQNFCQDYSDTIRLPKNDGTIFNKLSLYKQIKAMMAEGKSIDIIAKETGTGIGEVKLIVSLYDRSFKPN